MENKVVVQDLVQEYGIDGKVIRTLARNLGLNAPETGVEGFGPKRKYEWAVDSPELEKLRQAIEQKLLGKEAAQEVEVTEDQASE